MQTPLHIAARSGDAGVARTLCNGGATVNAQNTALNTPLHVAARHGNVGVVSVLLEKGAEIDAGIDIYRLTPLQAALEGALLRDDSEALAQGIADVVRVLALGGADLRVTTCLTLNTPLHLAARCRFIVVLDALLDTAPAKTRVCDDITALNEAGEMPLHSAATGAIVRRLLSLEAADDGLLLEVQPKNGWTPLHSAVRSGRDDVVAALLEREAGAAALWVRDAEGRTPLYLATEYRHRNLVATLLFHRDRVSDKSPTDSDTLANIATHCGVAPMHVAAHYGDASTVVVLLWAGARTDVRAADVSESCQFRRKTPEAAARANRKYATADVIRDSSHVAARHAVALWAHPFAVGEPPEKLSVWRSMARYVVAEVLELIGPTEPDDTLVVKADS